MQLNSYMKRLLEVISAKRWQRDKLCSWLQASQLLLDLYLLTLLYNHGKAQCCKLSFSAGTAFKYLKRIITFSFDCMSSHDPTRTPSVRTSILHPFPGFCSTSQGGVKNKSQGLWDGTHNRKHRETQNDAYFSDCNLCCQLEQQSCEHKEDTPAVCRVHLWQRLPHSQSVQPAQHFRNLKKVHLHKCDVLHVTDGPNSAQTRYAHHLIQKQIHYFFRAYKHTNVHLDVSTSLYSCRNLLSLCFWKLFLCLEL